MNNDKEDSLIRDLLASYKGPEDLIGENGLLKRLTKKLVEGALGAELTHHLGYEKHDGAGQGSGNSRNGASSKTLRATSVKSTSRCRAIATAASSRRSSANISAASPASMTKSCRCTRAA
jgi:hypothetical protein